MITIIIVAAAIVFLFVSMQLGVFFQSKRQKGRPVPFGQLSMQTKNLLKDKKAIVYFYTPTCPPCKLLSPVMEKLKKDNLNVAMIDTSHNLKDARAFGVMGTPTTVFIENNIIKNVFVGFRDEGFIRGQYFN